MICVTHEMGFARQVADRVIFMDEGQIVEMNDARGVLREPAARAHQALPQPDPALRRRAADVLSIALLVCAAASASSLALVRSPTRRAVAVDRRGDRAGSRPRARWRSAADRLPRVPHGVASPSGGFVSAAVLRGRLDLVAGRRRRPERCRGAWLALRRRRAPARLGDAPVARRGVRGSLPLRGPDRGSTPSTALAAIGVDRWVMASCW